MSITKWETYEPEDEEDDEVPPHSGPRQLPLPGWTMRGDRMTVSDVAQFLGLTTKRITQLADEFVMSLGRTGLPHIRTDYGRRERLFFSEDVETYKRWRMAKDEARIEYLQTWRAPVAARRA